jgi:hypothetical protein
MKKIKLTILLALLCAALHAQNARDTQSAADRTQALLQTSAVSYAQAARFVLEAAGAAEFDKTSEDGAARYAMEKKWLPAKADAGGAISLEALSLLIMKAFALKGGPMYSLFGGAHFSYREMVFKDYIQGRSDPRMKVSGEQMLFIVSRLLYLTEENPWDAAGAEALR